MQDSESNLQQSPQESTEVQQIEAPAFLDLDEAGRIYHSGKCNAGLYNEYMLMVIESGSPLRLAYREIESLTAEAYRIIIKSIHQSTWVLSKLGYQFEDFYQKLVALRNEVLIKDLLLQDTLHLTVPKCSFKYRDPLYDIHLENQGAVRIYETKLVALTDNGPCVILPLALVKEISFSDLAITLETDSGETFHMEKMGWMLDPFKKSLSDARNNLSQRVMEWLSKLLPEIDATAHLKLSRLLPEGRAANLNELKNINSRFENALQDQVDTLGRNPEFALLRNYAVNELIHVGYKRGLWGDLAGDYLWFLYPIADPISGRPINLMVLETLSNEGEGHRATFLFKVLTSSAFAALNASQLSQAVTQAVSLINRSLLSINFRREPIYLDEAKLRTPEYSKYYFAVRQLPALHHLRQLYIGRVFHTNTEQWQADVQKLLQETINH